MTSLRRTESAAMARLIDNVPVPEVRPIKIIVAGLPRTGTLSLHAALQELGYKPYHFLVDEPEHGNRYQLWTEALQCKYLGKNRPYARSEFERLLGPFDACLDLPGSMFWDDLFDAYPDSKVILTTRDVDSWLKSMHQTIFAYMDSTLTSVMRYIGARRVREDIIMVDLILRLLFKDDRGEVCRQVFFDHNEKVRRTIPPDQFFEQRIGDGWDGLCAFLDVPVPSGPFPRSNSAEELNQREMDLFWKRTWSKAKGVLIYSCAAAVLVTAVWCRDKLTHGYHECTSL